MCVMAIERGLECIGRTSEGVSEWRNRTGEVIGWHLEYLRHMGE